MTVAVKKTVTVKELAEVLSVSERSVQRRAAKEKWEFVEVNGKGRGGKVRSYLTDALPEEIRVDVLRNNSTFIYRGESDVIYVGSPELSEQQNKVALAKADLVRLYLAEKKKAKQKKRSVTRAANDFIAAYNTGHLLPKLFAVLGKTSAKTVERWAVKWKKSNYDYTALADHYGNRKGCRKVTHDELNMALSFYLQENQLRYTQAVRYTKMTLKRRNIPSPSSEATICRAIKDWEKDNYDIMTLRRKGEKALNDNALPYAVRNIDLLEVGEVLVADGHTLNFDILHPFTGKPCRMSMVLWYDWASRFPAGWEIMPTENVQSVAAGLRNAVLNLGKIPLVAYLDNGKAFKAKVFTDKTIDFEEAGFYGMFARLGIETVFAWPYHGQSKPVERFFGTFNEIERLMPTYTGASIEDKPAHLLRNEKLHQKLHKKKYGGWVPTIDQANNIIAGWMTEYAKRPHRGLKGLCPLEVWGTGRGPGVDPEALNFLMMHMEIKTIHRNGVTLMGRDYYDEALYGLRDRVMIRYDIRDLRHIHVFDKTGAKKICTAEAIVPVHPMARLLGTKEDLALVKHEAEKKRRLKKATEAAARQYVEDAPALVAVPEETKVSDVKPEPKKLTRGEAERIEAAAARMEVVELTPKAPEPMYISEPDRYEALLERECMGEELPMDDLQFMRYFEKTDLFEKLKDRFEFLRENWIAGPEKEVMRDG